MKRSLTAVAAVVLLTVQVQALAVTETQNVELASNLEAKTDRIDQFLIPKQDLLPAIIDWDGSLAPSAQTITFPSGPGQSMAIRIPLLTLSFDYD